MIVFCIYRIIENYYMVISIYAQKLYYKIQHAFSINIFKTFLFLRNDIFV